MNIEDDEQIILHTICMRKSIFKDGAALYCLVQEVSGDISPVMYQDKLVLFTHLDRAAFLLSVAGIEPHCFQNDEVLFMDVSDAVTLLKEGKVDEHSIIINLLNLMSDIFAAAGIKLPGMYKNDLIALADYLTFNKDLDAFFVEKSLSRGHLADAVMWCVGTLLCSSIIA